MTDTSFMLTGIPPNKSWYGMRASFGFTEGERLRVVVSGLKVDGDEREHYETGFYFHAGPLEVAAAMILSLVRSRDALFAWTGNVGESGDPWVLRAHWFRNPGLWARGLGELEQLLKAGSEVDTDSGNQVLTRLKRQTAREPLYSLTVEQVAEGHPARFPFVLQPASQTGVFSACRKAALSRDDLYLVGGLRVMTVKGDICLAAGSSGLVRLDQDQRSALRLSIQKAIESERAVSLRMKEVSCFAPRRSNGQPFWSVGLRVSVLGRTAPLSTAREAAELLAVL